MDVEFKKLIKRFPLRSFGDFLNFSTFSLPSNVNKGLQRVETNVQFFLANYILYGVFVFLYCAISSLFFAFCVLFCCIYWLYVLIFLIGPENVAERVDFRKYGAPIVVSTKKFVIYSLIGTLVILSVSSGFLLPFYIGLCAIHTILRKPSVRSQVSSLIDKVQGNSISNHAEQVIDKVISEQEEADQNQRNRESMESRQRYYNTRDQLKAKYFSK